MTGVGDGHVTGRTLSAPGALCALPGPVSLPRHPLTTAVPPRSLSCRVRWLESHSSPPVGSASARAVCVSGPACPFPAGGLVVASADACPLVACVSVTPRAASGRPPAVNTRVHLHSQLRWETGRGARLLACSPRQVLEWGRGCGSCGLSGSAVRWGWERTWQHRVPDPAGACGRGHGPDLLWGRVAGPGPSGAAHGHRVPG